MVKRTKIKLKALQQSNKLNIKPIINLFGVLLIAFSLVMLVPFMIGVIYSEDNHQIYIFVFIIVFAFGLFLWLLSRGTLKEIRIT
ncbi:MAG: hypothetical protein CM15mP127_00030 [Gammaproteobacteria bacterium]|nr:MAG: hypothetical protein CM15mP127_00030 [Gammaproteobacteria bacterium]